jgi:hypothetical protein
MAEHDPDKGPGGKDVRTEHPRVAIFLLSATALVSVVAVVINLGRDSLSAIAATLGVASALTLIAFAYRAGRH